MTHTILIVEDDENDRLFEKLAFDDIGFGDHLRFARDGNEAIDYLEGRKQFKDRARYPLPGVILLDLNLPSIPGLQVLRWIRSRPQFNATLVLPLTSSNNPVDIEEARNAGADDYLVKPLGMRGWREVAHHIESTGFRAPEREQSWGALRQSLAA